jgi:DNA-directed RNA polymerase specialized sigma subunit
MTKIEYLSQVYKLQLKIDKKKIRAEEYERLSMSIPGPNYDQPVVDKTRSLEAPFVKWIGKLIDIQKEIEELEKKLDVLKAEVIGVIETLENEDYKNVLALRYISGFTWTDICEKLYISRATVHRWHDKAVEILVIPKIETQ